MIDPKELRIGNWVQYAQPMRAENYEGGQPGPFGTLYGVVEGVKSVNGYILPGTPFEQIWLQGFQGVIHPNMLAGVPLTPEILEKCGFKKYQKGTIAGYSLLVNKPDEDYFQLSKSAGGWHLRVGIDWIYPHPYKPFLYVHQLQNLVFALNGVDLGVKL